MATTLTPNLKLRISNDLTPDAIYNLNRIDTVGATFFITDIGNTNIVSQGDINILPNSPDVGGPGVGGNLNVSFNGQSLTSLNVYADSSLFYGNVQADELRLPDDIDSPTYYSGLRASASLAASTTWTLPTADGTVNQVLTTNGSGQLAWSTILTATLPQSNIRVGNASSISIDTDTSSLGDILASTITGLTYKAGSILNAAVAASAQIGRSKLATGTADHVVTNNASGIMSSEAQLAIVRGGTAASTASGARANLGLAIGSDVQAYDPDLTDIAALTQTPDNIIISNGSNWIKATPATYFTILGLDDMATQNSASVAITGGAIDGTTLGTSTAAAVRATSLTITGTEIDVDAAGPLNIGASVGANDISIGEATSKVVILGDFEVLGTTTTLSTTTLDVTDVNITVNKAGSQATADNTAGLTVEMTDATDASIIYDKDAATFWRIGEVGAEIEVVDISTAQTLTNKTIAGTGIYKDTWIDTDGASKTITHSLGTTDVSIVIYDITTGETQYVDTEVRDNNTQVTLTASVAPPASGWKVLIKEYGA